MKIIEKKCPNCGANLDFEVGEHNVSCGSCRRKFAILYDRDEDIENLKSSDVTLKANHKAFIAISICAILVCILAVVGIIVSAINHENHKKDAQRMQEEAEQQAQEINDEFNQRVEESQREFNERVEESQREFEERSQNLK